MRCEIRIRGVLDERWSSWFAGLEIRSEGREVTVIRGRVADQVGLRGLISRIADLGLEVISVHCTEDGDVIAARRSR
jgi:hypothetical protein